MGVSGCTLARDSLRSFAVYLEIPAGGQALGRAPEITHLRQHRSVGSFAFFFRVLHARERSALEMMANYRATAHTLTRARG